MAHVILRPCGLRFMCCLVNVYKEVNDLWMIKFFIVIYFVGLINPVPEG